MKNTQIKLGLMLIILILAIGTTATVSIKNQNFESYKEQLELNGQLRYISIFDKMHDYETVALSVRQLFLASSEVTRDDFNTFVTPILERHREIQAIEWIPEVTREMRETYELAALKDGLVNFEFKGLVDGKLVTSPEEEVYYPVYYVQPYIGNEAAQGLNLGSNTARKESLMQAREWDKATISEPIRLVQDEDGGFGFLMIYAIQSEDYFNGYVLVVYKVNDFIEESLSVHKNLGLEIVLVDISKENQQEVIYESARSKKVDNKRTAEATITKKIEFGGRVWSLLFVPTAKYQSAFLSTTENLILIVTLIMAILITMYLITIWQTEKQLASKIEDQLAEIKDGQEQLQLALQGAGQAIWDWNLKTGKTRMGSNWVNLIGYEQEELNSFEDPWKIIIHPIDYQRVQDIITRFINGEVDFFHAEYRMIKKNGDVAWFYDEGRLFDVDVSGKANRCAGTVHDVTELVRLRNKLKQKAIIDPLTGLYNRRHLFDELEKMFNLHRRHKQQYCFVILDIDHFKNVNDTYGHQAGDFVLSQFASLLKDRLRHTDLLARYGGEEFVAILNEVSLAEAAQTINQLRIETDEKFLKYGEFVLHHTFSAGVVSFSEVESLEDVISLSDERLYAAKETGRNKVIAD